MIAGLFNPARSLLLTALAFALPAGAVSAHVGVLTPNGGEVFSVGDQVTISWTVLISHNTANWDIFYSLNGVAPWTDFHMDIPAVGDISVGSIHSYTATIIPELIGTSTRFRVRMDNVTGTDYYDKCDADFTVLPGPWDNLGLGLAGTNGEGNLVGTGDMSGGSTNSIDLTNAMPSSTAFLFLGFTEGNAPFKMGTLVPVPIALSLALPTDAEGALALPFVWPTGVPSGAEIYFHYWYPDAGGPVGAAASNALRATTP